MPSGFVPVANTPDEFAAVIKVGSERWAKVIHAANIKEAISDCFIGASGDSVATHA